MGNFLETSEGQRPYKVSRSGRERVVSQTEGASSVAGDVVDEFQLRVAEGDSRLEVLASLAYDSGLRVHSQKICDQ